VLHALWRSLECCYFGCFPSNNKSIDFIRALVCVVCLHITKGLGAQEIRDYAISPQQLSPKCNNFPPCRFIPNTSKPVQCIFNVFDPYVSPEIKTQQTEKLNTRITRQHDCRPCIMHPKLSPRYQTCDPSFALHTGHRLQFHCASRHAVGACVHLTPLHQAMQHAGNPPRKVVQALTMLASAWLILPASCSLLSLKHMRNMALMLPSIRDSFSWFACNNRTVSLSFALLLPFLLSFFRALLCMSKVCTFWAAALGQVL